MQLMKQRFDQPEELPSFISASQLAEYWGISRYSVYRMWKRGDLGYHPFGGQKRSSRADVLEYHQKHGRPAK